MTGSKHRLIAILAGVLLSLQTPTKATEAEPPADLNEAQRLVFMNDHLVDVASGNVITYDFRRRGKSVEAFSDTVKVNVTAMMTLAQVRQVAGCVAGGGPCYVSVFAGRIADTGRDPVPIMAAAVELLRDAPNAELIWASPRELLNIFQADAVGCDIITVTNDVLKKLEQVGKPLDEFSLDTVKMFHRDAETAGYRL